MSGRLPGSGRRLPDSDQWPVDSRARAPGRLPDHSRQPPQGSRHADHPRSVQNLCQRGARVASGVSLDIPNGMFGLLGPNGAGKSTLMRTIATLQDPDAGSIKLDDMDVLADKPAARRLLGYLPQEFGVYPKVSAEAMLDHFAVLKGVTARERTPRTGRVRCCAR